jgi:hypothetical protein
LLYILTFIIMRKANFQISVVNSLAVCYCDTREAGLHLKHKDNKKEIKLCDLCYWVVSSPKYVLNYFIKNYHQQSPYADT